MPPGTPPNNQYDFINKAGKQPKKPAFTLPENGSQGQRIAIFSGIIVVVFIFVFFVIAMASRGGEDKAVYVSLVQRQSELVRTAMLGSSEKAANANIKNTATNIQLAVASDKQALVATLTKKKIKLKGKELNGTPNEATTKLLTDAKAAANFDSTLISTLTEQLTDYRSALDQTYNQTKSKSIKETLSQSYKHTDLLQKQLEATQP
jgi:hypothetical protein